MKSKRNVLLIIICSLLVFTVGLTYAYYSASVQGTGNTNAESSARTATLGEVEFNGENTFDTTNIGRDIYPGFIGVQTFTISPYKDGHGIYEIDLEANVPAAFGSDIMMALLKTSDSTNNYIQVNEGYLTQNQQGFFKQDTLTITGDFEQIYEGVLDNTSLKVLETVEFTISNNSFTNPTITPDGYYTYYVIYSYLNNGNQNNQQGLDFDSKITVKYVDELYNPSKTTLEQLQALNNTIQVTPSTDSNPNFALIAPHSTPGISYSASENSIILINGINTYMTYASDFTYDDVTGQYTLTNYTTCKYSDCYNDLIDKYVIVADNYSYGSVTNEPVYQSMPEMKNLVHKITSTDSNGNIGVVAFLGSELNEVKEGTWETQTSGLFEAEDDYGTSYYFRGDITNNYVKFGKWKTNYCIFTNDRNFETVGTQYCEDDISDTQYASEGDDMYWRIIRINGDGSIRMIYDGTSAHDKYDLEYDADTLTFYEENIRSLGSFKYSNDGSDNAYVGYMYGRTNSNNYASTHANINDNTIKTELDKWFQWEMTDYASFLSDTIFCNDRSLASDDVINRATPYFSYSIIPYTLGYARNTTLYAPYGRMLDEAVLGKGNKMSLKCLQKNDAFTVSDTAHGNGALTYPVGLMTMDEFNMAGASYDKNENRNLYLFTGGNFWLSSSAFLSSYAPSVFFASKEGSISFDSVNNSKGVRPVINLKPGSIIRGSGTAQDPFVVE